MKIQIVRFPITVGFTHRKMLRRILNESYTNWTENKYLFHSTFYIETEKDIADKILDILTKYFGKIPIN